MLPSWLSLADDGVTISGTAPETTFSIAYPVVATASSDMYNDTQSWNIIVYPDASTLAITSTPNASVNSASAYTYIPLSNLKGVTWTWYYLPSWLSFSDGILYGVAPICETDTDYLFSVRCTYNGTEVEQSITIKVLAYVADAKTELTVEDDSLEPSQINSRTFHFTFNDYSDLGIRMVVWDFGDGTGSITTSPYHTYETAGTYLVTCTFYGVDGTSGEVSAYVTAVEQPSMWESLIDFLSFYSSWIILAFAGLFLLYLFTKPGKVVYVKSKSRKSRRSRR